jgi:hypothetical protein
MIPRREVIHDSSYIEPISAQTRRKYPATHQPNASVTASNAGNAVADTRRPTPEIIFSDD